MSIKPITIYTGLVSFLVGLICGGILIGSPREAFASVIVGVVALLVLYTLYLWRIGRKT
jgi:hypothetical protein